MNARGVCVARWYDPNTSEFMTVDPELAETGQPYAFAGDDPVNETDPSGMLPKCVWYEPWTFPWCATKVASHVLPMIEKTWWFSELGGRLSLCYQCVDGCADGLGTLCDAGGRSRSRAVVCDATILVELGLGPSRSRRRGERQYVYYV